MLVQFPAASPGNPEQPRRSWGLILLGIATGMVLVVGGVRLVQMLMTVPLP
jgi:hypothetical protein